MKEDRFCKPRLNSNGEISSTRFLYVAGVGEDMGSDKLALASFFGTFGELDFSYNGEAIDMIPNRRYCYVCYADSSSAEKAMAFLTGERCTPEHLLQSIGASKVIVRYSMEKSSLPVPSELECTSSERNLGVTIPGCHVIPNFITGACVLFCLFFLFSFFFLRAQVVLDFCRFRRRRS